MLGAEQTASPGGTGLVIPGMSSPLTVQQQLACMQRVLRLCCFCLCCLPMVTSVDPVIAFNAALRHQGCHITS